MSQHSPEFEHFAERVRRELVPMIKSAAATVSIVPVGTEKLDVKFAVELGLSVMLDKPIIAAIRPGTPIPEKLARVVDRFVELDLDDPTWKQRMQDAISETIADIERKKT